MNQRQKKKIVKRKQWGMYRGRYWMSGNAFGISRDPEANRLGRLLRSITAGEALVQNALGRGLLFSHKRGQA